MCAYLNLCITIHFKNLIFIIMLSANSLIKVLIQCILISTALTGLDKQKFLRKIMNIFLPIIFSICFGCSKEPSHRDSSFEYP